jgi:hypothetical protein
LEGPGVFFCFRRENKFMKPRRDSWISAMTFASVGLSLLPARASPPHQPRAVCGRPSATVLRPGFETSGWAYSGGQL